MENKKFYSLKYDQVFKNVFFRDINLLKYFLAEMDFYHVGFLSYAISC